MNRFTLKRSVYWLLVLLLAFSTLAACGGNGEEPEDAPAGEETGEVTEPTGEEEDMAEPEPAEEEAPTEEEAAPAEEEAAAGEMADSLRVSSVPGAMHDTLQALADQYEAENEGVEVTIEDEPEGGAFQALIAAGNQPDLVITSLGPGLGQLAADGALVALDSMPGFEEALGRVEQAAIEQLSGSYFYLPVGADVTMMIYNKELFEEAGLDPEDPPETWDEFLTAAEAIDNLGDDIYGTVFWNDALGWGGWYWNMLQPIYLNGNQGECQLLNRLGTDVVFDDPACNMEAFFEFTAQAQQYAPPTMEENFFSRNIGMWMQYGYSWEPNLETAADQPMVIGEDVGVAPVPVQNAGDQAFTTYGGRAAVIMETDPARQARAWDFLLWFLQPENNMTFLTELGYLPTLTELYDEEYFQDPARQPFTEMLANGVLPQQFSAAETVANEVQAVYQRAVVDPELAPNEAVAAAAEEARRALEESQ
jgi:multiple sugar transport system substrate-binding protein